jgi:3'-phosphoadenosine 5'-phosphosulfate sulfotransferase (PAPS reductase)/FAD synthetase
MTVKDAVALAVSRVADAYRLYKPVRVSAGLSGGHDSITATYIASLFSPFHSAFHIDTGVGLRATEDFVLNACEKMGWELEVYRALENTKNDGTPDPQDYFELVEERGFPGPAMHFKMYQRLKERQIYRWCRAHKKFRSRQVLMLVSGRRSQESARRMGKVTGPHERMKKGPAVVWANPVYDFSKLDCSRIMEFAGLPRSPVVDLVHKSGECYCGAFAKPGELAETTLWFPNDPTVVRLNAVSKRMTEERGWGWGGRPPKAGCLVKGAGPMCASCDAANANNLEAS